MTWKIERVSFEKSVGIILEGFNSYQNDRFRWSFGYAGEYALGSSTYVVSETAEVQVNLVVLKFLQRHFNGKDEVSRELARSLLHRSFTEEHVRLWMSANQTNTYDLTQIVEEAARYFDQDHEGGPLDQPDHWIWFTPKV